MNGVRVGPTDFLTAMLITLLCVILLAGCGTDRDQRFNRLADADSPYLRQHADNPVHWYEWGAQALEEAHKQNKPLIISIGYASCHWCHVMEEESFMDTAVARIMNDNFVCIKVDREQRPDIDQIYLNAAQLLSGNAGWPLNAFALPDGRPFFAATYFPKDEWTTLLQQVADAYRNEHETIVREAAALTADVQRYEHIATRPDSAVTVDQKSYGEFFNAWQFALDAENGGLAGAPKFPMPVNWEFLLEHHLLTGDQRSLASVTKTLDRMAFGGLYDHIGGGFFRYSTDDQWRVPHFEKMLYDNAQLVSLYAHAYRLTKEERYRRIVEETLSFLAGDLLGQEGGFYSSLNADSEGEEGRFYTWRRTEVMEALDSLTGALVGDYYSLTDEGNWVNGKNVLYVVSPPEVFAGRNHLSVEAWDRTLGDARLSLARVRRTRVPPTRDEKVLTSWNALMLTALTDAYRATGHVIYREMALKNADFLAGNMTRRDGGLWRSYSNGRATIGAFLDDYALLAQGYIDLYEVTFDVRWLQEARRLADYSLAHFGDAESGLCFYTAEDSESLVVRKMEVADHVMPSSNSALAWVLFQLGEYYQESAYTTRSRTMLQQILRNRTGEERLYYANWLRLAGHFTVSPYEVAIVGDSAVYKALELQRDYTPLALYLGGREENLPLLRYKRVEGKTMIYVCQSRVCMLPVDRVSAARLQLQSHNGVSQ